ncbi:MAG: thermonuclease family protein [Rubrobacteraceae bacterium]
MDLLTTISRSGGPTSSLRPYGTGIRVWRATLTGVLAALILLTVLVAPSRAQDDPGVETGDGTVRAGEVFAGDGCAKAGDVAAGDCDKDSGKKEGGDGDAAGGNTETPANPSDRPQSGNGGTEPDEEPDAEEDTSRTTGTTGSGEPEDSTGGTTVTETTAPGLSETTGPEESGSTATGKPAACPAAPPENAQSATVARAIDGDTVELQEPVDGYGRVRLIGVDTPEMMGGENGPPETGAEEAKAFTAEALEGQQVALETDEEIEDDYGRLLAYVWIPGNDEAETNQPEFFNRTLVDQGYADVMNVEPNDSYAGCLKAAQNEPQDEAPDTTGASPRNGGDKDKNDGLLSRLRNLISSEEPSGEQTTTNEDQYGQGGTTGGLTGGPMPTETLGEEAFQGDTSQEGTSKEDTLTEDTTPNPPAGSTSEQYRRGERQEPEVQEPEVQDPEIQESEVQEDPLQEFPADPPARSSELGPDLELPDSTPDELDAPHPAQPVETDADTDAGLDTKTDAAPPPDQAQITTLPETSGVPLTQLAALPAGILLFCSGLVAALLCGPRETRRNDSGG